MKFRKLILLTCCAWLFLQAPEAQDTLNIQFGKAPPRTPEESARDTLDIQFGKISPKDFDLSGQKFDSAANAVIIADIGNTSFECTPNGDFTLVFTRFVRVKILNTNGFDIADYQVSLFNNGSGDGERISNLEASTFNLEKKVVVETKLDIQSVYLVKFSKYVNVAKFTMPALQAGSIYDLTYTIKSDFYERIRPWNFQGKYPILWSEYKVSIPQMFHYLERVQGDQRFDIDTVNTVTKTFTVRKNGETSVTEVLALLSGLIEHRWVKKNVPALKEEAYIACMQNYLAGVSFKLNYIQMFGTSGRYNILGDWISVCNKLLNREDFGVALDENNHWMTKELKSITGSCKTDVEKLNRIYCFVRDNFTCTDHDEIYVNSSLKDVFKKRTGNVAEINLLLTAMLRHENIQADPAILSTRDNGLADQSYPLMNQFNYVICIAHAGNKMIKLDASQPYSAFGNLVEDCYNGEARIINKDRPDLIQLSPDSLTESNLTLVFIENDDKGFPGGSFQSTLGNAESFELRKEIKTTSEKDFFKKLQTGSRSDINIENPRIDSLWQLDYPVSVHFDFDLKTLLSDSVVYFNPFITEIDKNNPFQSAERNYPVEMPFKMEQTYVLNMDIPKGYSVDELPKSARVAYNMNEGIFEYLIQKSKTDIQMRIHLKLNKAFFPTEEYSTLRDFFAYVVKKENEQIVFKKIP